MKVGFLVWNQFQVAHFAEIARQFDEPDFIFLDRDPKALKRFNPAWLAPYGAFARFVPEVMLHTLDGKYDALVAQFRPPLRKPFASTRLLIQQYSLAKPKTAYNARWFAADHGLVYGDYSAGIIGQMCPVSKVGNPRFDPLLEGRLDPVATDAIAARLDPAKKTLLYLPTWGDLNSSEAFLEALGAMSSRFNVVVRMHHMTPLRDGAAMELPAGVIDAATLPPMLDPGIHLLQCADLVVSDMSGAIFDALYCRKPVVLVGDEAGYDAHKKADDTAIEVSQRHRIGPFVTDPARLAETIDELLASPDHYRQENEALVAECFSRRGGCSPLAADAIRAAVESEAPSPALQAYAAPDFATLLSAKALAAAVRRSKRRQAASTRKAPGRAGPKGRISRLVSGGKGTVRKPQRSIAAQLRTSVKSGNFLNTGLDLEGWCKLPRTTRANSILQAYAAASAVRFSRSAWKIALAKLFDGKFAPETDEGIALLRKCGMVRTAAALQAGTEEGLPSEVSEQLDSLGPVGAFVDVAARNEVAPLDGQQCVEPGGGLVELASADPARVVEVYIALSVIRQLKDEAQRPYRGSQLSFVRNLLGELTKLGAVVYPRVQGGVIGATPVSGKRLALTWHTLDAGVPGQFHLKLGSLFGHFVIDSKGYSGWASIADAGLDDLVSGVDPGAADAHWRRLHADLVVGGKSKYSQAEEEPADWGRYIFFPMQVADDAVARLADISTLELLQQLKAWADGQDLKVVVKRHPMCKSKEVAQAIEEGVEAGSIHVSNANVHELVAGAECVVTVNSGVGAEALLQLKPVVTTGKSDYAPATTRVRTPAELADVLDRRAWSAASEDDIKRFLWVYTNQYMVHCDDMAAIASRLRFLLEGAGFAGRSTEPPARLSVDLADPARIPFCEVPKPANGTAAGALPLPLRQVTSELEARGVGYWLEAEALATVVGATRYGKSGGTTDIGVWSTDLQSAVQACEGVAKALRMKLRTTRVGGATTGLRLRAQGRGKRDVRIRVYRREGEHAWTARSVSMVAANARYPRHVYMRENGEGHASLPQKLGFLVAHPIQSACLLASKLGKAPRVDAWTKSQGRIGRRFGKPLRRLLRIHLVERVPVRYFEGTEWIEHDGSRFRVPAAPSSYLLARHGEPLPDRWLEHVDDSFAHEADSATLERMLASADSGPDGDGTVVQGEQSA